MSHDHRNDQRRRSDPTGEHGHLPGAVEKEGGSRPKRMLRSEVFTLFFYMMIYDIVHIIVLYDIVFMMIYDIDEEFFFKLYN